MPLSRNIVQLQRGLTTRLSSLNRLVNIPVAVTLSLAIRYQAIHTISFPATSQRHELFTMPGLTSNNHIQDSPEYQAISTYLDNGSPQDKAIDTFCEPIEDHFMKTQNPEDIEPLLWRAWQSITTIAAETPHESEQKRQKLSDLVIKIQARPVLESNGTTCNVWDAAVWKDLPVFGAQVREAWNSGRSSYTPKSALSC